MPTTNPRVYVTLEKSTAGLLAHLAHKQHKSMAKLIKELTDEALEMHEDYYLAKLAAKLDKPGAKTCSHEEAWK